MYFIPLPAPFIFILPEAIISITEQSDEFYDKRTFLMERRRVFMLATWANSKIIRVLLPILVKSPVIARVGYCPDLLISCYISVFFPSTMIPQPPALLN
jgi:hypothetical protein